jgi:hypothetical protein
MRPHSFLISVFCCFSFLAVNAQTPSAPQERNGEELIVYNRILAKVNGKTISVIDVMKKMDLSLQKHYPHLMDSKVAKYQFYSTQWREFLTQMIDTELMIADAEKLEIKVTDAEVREEILNRFGQNVMPELEKLGIGYEEAKAMIHDEIVVNRMQWFRVNAKALSKVNSQDIKEAYQDYCAKNPEMQQWQYEVLSIRSPDKTASEALASRAIELLNNKLALASVTEQLKTPDEATAITLSDEMQADEKTISTSHKEVLQTLAEGEYSAPIPQVSRADNSVVYRIFHLKKHSKKELSPFEKMADPLKENLLQQVAEQENKQYITKLRQRLGYDEKHTTETLPTDFEPFALR